jgi:hypothetical protein
MQWIEEDHPCDDADMNLFSIWLLPSMDELQDFGTCLGLREKSEGRYAIYLCNI